MRLTRILTYAVMFLLCGSATRAQDAADVKSDIERVRSEIEAARAEDAQYTGGLIKTLIANRIAILRQTEAMLQQKLASLKFGIPVKYLVDGKVFRLPDTSAQMLSEIDSEVFSSRVKIHEQEAEAARYTGGLVQATALVTLETLRQSHAMLEQKRISLAYGLPQYIGFNNLESDASAPSARASGSASATYGTHARDDAEHAAAADLRRKLTLNVVEKGFIPADPSAQRYEAFITFKCSYENVSEKDIRAFTGTIVFQDLFGKEIAKVGVTISNPIRSGQQAVWNGTMKYSQFVESHQRLLGARLGDLTVVWVPAAIMFSDGTRLGEGGS
jgi:hypothetical protein